MAVAVAPAAAAAILAVDIAETVLIQIVGQLVSATLSSALAPEFLELQQESFRLTNTRALDPSLSVEAFVKGHRSAADSQNDVAAQGYSGDLWRVMAAATGQPPPLDFLTEAWRRGFIDKEGLGDEATTLQQGVYESLLKNKWFATLLRMQYRLADPGTLIEGWVRAVIPEATARAELQKAGFDTATQDLMHLAAGRPPSPQELQELYHRGLIDFDTVGPDALSLKQGFLETDLKDKWWPKWQHLGDYLPPPRTVTALIREGALSDAQGLDYFKKSGLSADLAAVYVAAAHHQKVAPDKALAKADVLHLYATREITAEQAARFLKLDGWNEANIGFLLGYEDFKNETKLVEQALARLRSLYIGHKIDKQKTLDAIDRLGVEPKARDQLLRFWQVDAEATPALLTAVQLATAAAKGWIPVQDAFDELQGRGFDPRDAMVVLLEHKADVKGLPIPAGITGTNVQ